MLSQHQVLQQIKTTVLGVEPAAVLILFGSYARGDYNDASDIDILVLLDKEKITNSDRERIGYPLYDIQLKENILITPIFYTKKNWDSRLGITPFFKNVLKDGIAL
jgi:predicted nucleotidyltransferase